MIEDCIRPIVLSRPILFALVPHRERTHFAERFCSETSPQR